MTPPANAETWADTLRDLLNHYLPELQPSPAVNVGSLLAVIAGLFLVFRSMKSDRAVVSAFALVLGAWLGYQISRLLDLPSPISAAIGGVALTVVAYRTYKWWLAIGSVLILFSLATIFQLGRGDLHRYLPDGTQVSQAIKDGKIELPATEKEQMKNLYADWKNVLEDMKEKVVHELKALGPTGWFLPVASAILGALLAYWALRAFSVVWLGFLGASIAVLGACTLVCAYRSPVRPVLFARPDVVAGAAVALWILGLIYQAKEARLPKKKPAPAKDSAKS